jgi:predicted AAA+ superfamily ATPase
MDNFLRPLRRRSDSGFIIIVSGLPRSGTSMMMKMLEAGGIAPYTDNIRTADEDNPKGYYEFERVKKLPDGDNEWLPDARGKAVKVISALLEHLPAE